VSAHRDDERKPELLAIRRVQPAEPRELAVVEPIQPGARLLGDGGRAQRPGSRGPPGQVRVGAAA